MDTTSFEMAEGPRSLKHAIYCKAAHMKAICLKISYFLQKMETLI